MNAKAKSVATAGDEYVNGHSYFGIKLDVGVGSGGPLFFAHYSFMGFDPRGLRDRFTNYFDNNRNMALINRAWVVRIQNISRATAPRIGDSPRATVRKVISIILPTNATMMER